MTRKTLAAGLAGAILLGAIGLGADIGADRWMAHRLDQALAQAPVTKASHGAIRYSLWRGRLDIDDLVVETSLPAFPSLRAAHVAATGIGPRYLLGLGAGDVALSGVAAEKLELASGKQVQLHYKEYVGTLPWRGYSKYVVDSIISIGGGK